MRKLLITLFVIMAMGSLAQAQTVVNLTVSDTPDNQTWNTGTWAVKLIPAPGNLSQTSTFTLLSGGGSLAAQNGALSGTGTAAITLPANANIGPAGTVWQFTVCPQASSGCFQQSVTVSTSTPQTLTLTPPSIRINLATATPPVSAYATGEISAAVLGSQFLLIGSGQQFCTAVSGTTCTTFSGSVATNVNNTFTGTQSFTNLTASGTVTAGNISNIRIIDGVKYAQTAAGINQADSDLTTANGAGTPGDIWVPANTTATDAQISIADGHTLRVMAALTIDAAGKGPILLGKYSAIKCSSPGGNNLTNVSIVQANTSTIPSMIRFRTQDGTLEMFSVTGCQLFAGNAGVSRGVIDVTGMNDRGLIRDNIISGFQSGWGIYGDSVLGLTGQFTLQNNWIVANGTTGTGSCIYLHGNTATNLLYDIKLLDNECQLQNNSGTNPALLIDNNGSANLVRDIYVNGMYFSSTPAGQYDISIVGTQNVLHPVLDHVVCAGNGSGTPVSNCINIGANVQLLDIISLWNFSDTGSTHTNTIVDNTVSPAITLTSLNNAHVPSYQATTAQSFFGPNLQVLPHSNFQGLQVGLASNGVQAPEIEILTGSATGTMRSWGFTANNNSAGDLEFLQSTSNINAPSVETAAIQQTNTSTYFRAFAVAADLGTVCTNGELVLSAGWQSTGSATVTAVAGNGQTCSWTITTGTTTAANPTVTDTLTNAFAVAPVCEMNIHGGTHTAAAGEGFQQTTVSTTAPVFTFNGTPTAGGTTYFVTRRCGP